MKSGTEILITLPFDGSKCQHSLVSNFTILYHLPCARSPSQEEAHPLQRRRYLWKPRRLHYWGRGHNRVIILAHGSVFLKHKSWWSQQHGEETSSFSTELVKQTNFKAKVAESRTPPATSLFARWTTAVWSCAASNEMNRSCALCRTTLLTTTTLMGFSFRRCFLFTPFDGFSAPLMSQSVHPKCATDNGINLCEGFGINLCEGFGY